MYHATMWAGQKQKWKIMENDVDMELIRHNTHPFKVDNMFRLIDHVLGIQ